MKRNSKPSLPEALRLPAMTLAAHAYEHERGSGIMSDRTAERWYAQLSYQYLDIPLPDLELTNGIVVRSMVIDYALLDFISTNQQVSVIDLGCGFSTRRYRLGVSIDSWVHIAHWINVDLPEVIQARREMQQDEMSFARDLTKIEHFPLGVSTVNQLVILEGVLNHLSKEAAKGLLRQLHELHPGQRVIGTVVTANGLQGAQSLIGKTMWAIEDPGELGDAVAPVKPFRIWLLGKVATRIGLIRPANADEASGLVFMATL